MDNLALAAAGTGTAAERAQRIRDLVWQLRGCLGSLPSLERAILLLRAALDRGAPRTIAQVARMTELPSRRVARLERAGLRRLRSLVAAGSCAPATGPSGLRVPALGGSVAGRATAKTPTARDVPGADGSAGRHNRLDIGLGPDHGVETAVLILLGLVTCVVWAFVLAGGGRRRRSRR